MKDELTKQQAHAILEALDEAIETGPWDESNFLRVIGKNLREIRDKFASHLSDVKVEANKPKIERQTHINRVSQRPDHQEIFISLYSSEGSIIQSWERILANLSRQIISRPIYSDEDAVRAFIKSKENKENEAYVAIYIDQADILNIPPDKIPVDKFGKPLLSLKDRAIILDNITRFVHTSGTYHYIKGRLVKNTQTE
ncbi:Dot/Icm secretion system protein IcmQ [Legionella micdadei]|uniref:Component of Dot/Icm secretion system. Pore-forming molecule n=1 Tax=Legionella micdadei TaxID=451 RepID=Q6E8N4_LEGMI|nr:Dot/Icm secretion system protein IcmQ [Legionella micdadei]AAS82945.1 IcmQ [Legionella micdadei]ARG96820.1 Dot/Icm secretion system protein IcmQ [Legionella micdadei]ARG99552.1 Dot/Icm secretion system protein IcmQ [Legionella micdadei]KTD26494.1 IcmQ protein [Legionella micdadei]NSL17916.1 Dot/Icm secretion system protein IcmQ [Legionella micdadei]